MLGRRSDRVGGPTEVRRRLRLPRAVVWTGALCVLVGAGYEVVSLYAHRPPDPARVVAQTLRLASQAEGADRSAEVQQQVLALKHEALAVAQKLVEQYPAGADAWCVLGLVASRCGNRSGAVQCWQRALELAPQFSLAWHCLGRDALQRGEYRQAVNYLRKALEAEPDVPEVLLALADALTHLDQPHEALESYKKHVRLAPGSVEGWFRLGQMYMQLREYGQAKACHKRVLELDPDCKLALHNLALVCERLGEQEEARKYRQAFAAREAKDRAPGEHRRPKYDDLAATQDIASSACCAAGRVYAAMGHAEAAEACWRKGAELSPTSTEPRLALLAFYEKQERLDDALHVAEELRRLRPQSPEYHLKAGWLHIRLGRVEAAEAAFRQAAEVAPEQPEGFVALAQLYLSQNRALGKAKEAASRAVALAPVAAHYFLLGTACQRLGDLPGARTALEEAARLDPGKPQYRQALAGVLVQMRLLPPLEPRLP